MTTLFFDELITANKLNKKINQQCQSTDEKMELWQMVEEIIHHRVLGCCLHHLPQEEHSNFLEMFHSKPFDKRIIKYLDEKTKKNMKKIIKKEINDLTKDLLLLDSHKM